MGRLELLYCHNQAQEKKQMESALGSPDGQYQANFSRPFEMFDLDVGLHSNFLRFY
jgi:hypothetical protein